VFDTKSNTHLTSLLEKAAEFHGHLGPFLTVGVRMGLVGLKVINKHDYGKLRIEASIPLHVPFSCIIDGLQFTTHCTIGNQRLSLKDSNIFQVRFKRVNDGLEKIVTLNRSRFKEVESELLGESTPEEVRRLAWKVANIPEDELFRIS
jgi:formylmethanofuran dehydrogenase subunit E